MTSFSSRSPATPSPTDGFRREPMRWLAGERQSMESDYGRGAYSQHRPLSPAGSPLGKQASQQALKWQGSKDLWRESSVNGSSRAGFGHANTSEVLKAPQVLVEHARGGLEEATSHLLAAACRMKLAMPRAAMALRELFGLLMSLLHLWATAASAAAVWVFWGTDHQTAMAVGMALLMWHYLLGAANLALRFRGRFLWAALLLQPLLDLACVTVLHPLRLVVMANLAAAAASDTEANALSCCTPKLPIRYQRRLYNLLQLLLQNRTLRLPMRALLECLPSVILQLVMYHRYFRDDGSSSDESHSYDDLQEDVLCAAAAANLVTLGATAMWVLWESAVGLTSAPRLLLDVLRYEGCELPGMDWEDRLSCERLVINMEDAGFRQLSHRQKVHVVQRAMCRPLVGITNKPNAVRFQPPPSAPAPSKDTPSGSGPAQGIGSSGPALPQASATLVLNSREALKHSSRLLYLLLPSTRSCRRQFVVHWQAFDETHVSRLTAGLLEEGLASGLGQLTYKDTHVGQEATHALCRRVVMPSCVLTKLVMSEVHMMPSVFAELCQALSANSSITHLDLSSNNMGLASTYEIRSLLRANSCLQHLNLSYTNMNCDGASEVLCGALESPCLQALDLSQNHVRDLLPGMDCVTLRRNTCLTSLDLSFNWIQEAMAGWIVTCLEAFPSLQRLSLNHNSYSAGMAGTPSNLSRQNTTSSMAGGGGGFVALKWDPDDKVGKERGKELVAHFLLYQSPGLVGRSSLLGLIGGMALLDLRGVQLPSWFMQYKPQALRVDPATVYQSITETSGEALLALPDSWQEQVVKEGCRVDATGPEWKALTKAQQLAVLYQVMASHDRVTITNVPKPATTSAHLSGHHSLGLSLIVNSPSQPASYLDMVEGASQRLGSSLLLDSYHTSMTVGPNGLMAGAATASQQGPLGLVHHQSTGVLQPAATAGAAHPSSLFGTISLGGLPRNRVDMGRPSGTFSSCSSGLPPGVPLRGSHEQLAFSLTNVGMAVAAAVARAPGSESGPNKSSLAPKRPGSDLLVDRALSPPGRGVPSYPSSQQAITHAQTASSLSSTSHHPHGPSNLQPPGLVTLAGTHAQLNSLPYPGSQSHVYPPSQSSLSHMPSQQQRQAAAAAGDPPGPGQGHHHHPPGAHYRPWSASLATIRMPTHGTGTLTTSPSTVGRQSTQMSQAPDKGPRQQEGSGVIDDSSGDASSLPLCPSEQQSGSHEKVVDTAGNSVRGAGKQGIKGEGRAGGAGPVAEGVEALDEELPSSPLQRVQGALDGAVDDSTSIGEPSQPRAYQLLGLGPGGSSRGAGTDESGRGAALVVLEGVSPAVLAGGSSSGSSSSSSLSDGEDSAAAAVAPLVQSLAAPAQLPQPEVDLLLPGSACPEDGGTIATAMMKASGAAAGSEEVLDPVRPRQDLRLDVDNNSNHSFSVTSGRGQSRVQHSSSPSPSPRDHPFHNHHHQHQPLAMALSKAASAAGCGKDGNGSSNDSSELRVKRATIANPSTTSSRAAPITVEPITIAVQPGGSSRSSHSMAAGASISLGLGQDVGSNLNPTLDSNSNPHVTLSALAAATATATSSRSVSSANGAGLGMGLGLGLGEAGLVGGLAPLGREATIVVGNSDERHPVRLPLRQLELPLRAALLLHPMTITFHLTGLTDGQQQQVEVLRAMASLLAPRTSLLQPDVSGWGVPAV